MADAKKSSEDSPDPGSSDSGSHLDALNEALEAEKASSDSWSSFPDDDASDGDGGVFTSAPHSDSVGSLLTDLLNEAKKEVEKERANLHAQIKERDDEQRLAKQRDEAQRREELQRKLMAETRRRNEALTRREREEAEERRLVAEEEAEAARAAAPAPQIEAPVEAPRKRSPIGLIALIALLVAGGAGAAFALQPKPEMRLPDIKRQVNDSVEKAALAWQAKQAEEARAAAEKKAAEAKARAEEEARKRQAAEAQAKLEAAEAEAKAKAEAEAKAAAEAAAKARRPAAAKRPAGKKLRLNTSVF